VTQRKWKAVPSKKELISPLPRRKQSENKEKEKKESFESDISDKLRIGCSGWSYKDWTGNFYPKTLPSSNYLSFYSRVFDCVEIDSSFYRIPLPGMIESWRKNTPDGFQFSPKMPKKITHEHKLENVGPILDRFHSMVGRLGEKLGPIVIQLPPSIKLDKHREVMESFLSEIPSEKFRHAIEFRHKSWFSPETYRLLDKHGVALCWSQNQYLTTPNDVTSGFVYLRMVGERDITDFSSTQKDRTEDMKGWVEKLKEKGSLYDDAFIFFNNHFAGFGPASVNEFRRLSGLMEMDWSSVASSDLVPNPQEAAAQKSLMEF
jgi:uncharacterized protein YecE (DUF72 family)